MNIHFDKGPGRVNDVLDSLYFICNKNYEKFAEKYNMDFNRQVSETLKYLDKNTNFDWNDFKFLFDYTTQFADTIFSVRNIWEIKEEKNILNYIKEMDASNTRNKIIKDILISRHINEDEWDFSKTDYKKVTELIGKMNVSQELKWQTLCFMQNTEHYLGILFENMNDYLKVYDDVMKKNKKTIDDFSSQIEKKIKENGAEYFKSISGNIMNAEHFENVHLSTGFFNSYSFVFKTYKDMECFFIGIDYEKTFKTIAGKDAVERNLKVFKNLSDNSRFQIVKLLNNGECYGQEIVNKVGISMATVNYHMDFLLSCGIAKIEREEGRRVYYSLNKEPIRNCIKFLQRTLDLDKD